MSIYYFVQETLVQVNIIHFKVQKVKLWEKSQGETLMEIHFICKCVQREYLFLHISCRTVPFGQHLLSGD